MAMETLRNPSHQMHELELKEYQKPYTCDGCKETGFGPRYRCEKCDFDLHKACMFAHNAPNSHEFFPGSTFEFLRNPPKCCDQGIVRCNACRKTINGFVFNCEKSKLDLHPCCRNLKKSYQIKDVEFNLHMEVKGKCIWCKNRRLKDSGGDRDGDNGWSYISDCGNYHVHVACVTEMVLNEWNRSGGNTAEKSLALSVNLKEISRRKKGGGGNKVLRILKIFIQTIVSIILGDPTTILASLFVQLIA